MGCSHSFLEWMSHTIWVDLQLLKRWKGYHLVCNHHQTLMGCRCHTLWIPTWTRFNREFLNPMSKSTKKVGTRLGIWCTVVATDRTVTWTSDSPVWEAWVSDHHLWTKISPRNRVESQLQMAIKSLISQNLQLWKELKKSPMSNYLLSNSNLNQNQSQ